MARGRGPSREQRLAAAREKLNATEAKRADLAAAEQLADRRFQVAEQAVTDAWEALEVAQRERDSARDDRAQVRDQKRLIDGRIRRLRRRVGDLTPPWHQPS